MLAGVFAGCEKNEEMPLASASEVNDVSVLNAVNPQQKASTAKVPAATAYWWWDEPLLNNGVLPENAHRWTGVSVPAGETRYVKFNVVNIPNYNIQVRHETPGVLLELRRNRGSHHLVFHQVGLSAVSTNSYGPQGSSSDGDYMYIKITNPTQTDVNNLIFNWNPNY